MALFRASAEVDERRRRESLHSRTSTLSAGRIALGYAAIAILWIAFSDAVVSHFKLSPWVMTIKGTMFVLVTASLLYFTIQRLVQAAQRTAQERKRAEEALRQSDAYLTEAQRLSHTGSWAFDVASNKYLYISEECFRIFELDPQNGYPTREAVSRLIHPEDWGGVQATYDKTLRERTDTPADFRIVLPSGTVKHVQTTRHPVLNDAGEVVRIVGCAIDVTERKRAEEERRQGAERFRAIADYTYDWENWIGVDGKLLWVNPAVERITGYSVDECMLMPEFPIPIVAEADRETVAREMREAVKGSSRNDFEFRVRRKDGHTVWVASSWQPIYDSGGARLGYRSSMRDIAERKRAEEALRESETRFRTFVDHAADALFVHDEEQHKVVDVNRRACESLDYTREELIGMVPQDFDPDVSDSLLKKLDEQVEAGGVFTFEARHRRKDGTVFPVEVRVRAFWHAGRRLHLALARDISERVRAEQQRERLRQLEADIAHMNRVSMMGELAASIAHEVNQPLSGVVNNGSACLRWLAGDTPNLEEARESARRIVRDGKRAGEVIARIRAMATKAAAPMGRLDLNQIIRDVLPLVGDNAKRRNVTIETRFADDLAQVRGDQVQLQQVLLNLFMNGIEAMGNISSRERGLVVSTRNIDGDQVQVTVEDSGAGIDPSTMQRIFEPFYTTKPGGMGMGLSVCRSIIQTHGGRLWATPREGPGASFHFTLPKYQEHAQAVAV